MLALGAFEAQAVKVRWQGEHSREVVLEATATCFRGWVGEGIADRSQYKSHALRRNFSKYMCAVPRVETESPFSVVPPLKIFALFVAASLCADANAPHFLGMRY